MYVCTEKFNVIATIPSVSVEARSGRPGRTTRRPLRMRPNPKRRIARRHPSTGSADRLLREIKVCECMHVCICDQVSN